MNNKRYIKLTLSIFILLALIMFPLKTLADSGFDTGYDGGGGDIDISSDFGSDSSSSDFDSDTSSSSSGGGYSGNGNYHINILDYTGFFFMIFMQILFTLFVVYIIKRSEKIKIDEQNYILTQEDINKVDPTITIYQIVQRTKEIYVKVQDAWMYNQQDELQKYLTDELYNQYIMQLDTLTMKNQQNIMDCINIEKCVPIYINVENNLETIEVEMVVSMYDYIIDKGSNMIVRGRDTKKVHINYIITLTRKIETGSDYKIVSKCPSCGCQIENQNINHCQICGTTIIQNTNNLVMSKKENISQW